MRIEGVEAIITAINTVVGDVEYEVVASSEVSAIEDTDNFDVTDDIIPDPVPIITESTPEYYVKFTSGEQADNIFRISGTLSNAVDVGECQIILEETATGIAVGDTFDVLKPLYPSMFNGRVYQFVTSSFTDILKQRGVGKMPCAFVRYAGFNSQGGPGEDNTGRDYSFHVILLDRERYAYNAGTGMLALAAKVEQAVRGLAVGHQDVELAINTEEISPLGENVIICHQEYTGQEFPVPIN